MTRGGAHWQPVPVDDGDGVCRMALRHLEHAHRAAPGCAHQGLTGALGLVVVGDIDAAVAAARSWAGEDPERVLIGFGSSSRIGQPLEGVDLVVGAAWLEALLELEAAGNGRLVAYHGMLGLAGPPGTLSRSVVMTAAEAPGLWASADTALARAGVCLADVVMGQVEGIADHLVAGLALAWFSPGLDWPFEADWRAGCGRLDDRRAPAWELAVEQLVAVVGGDIVRMRPAGVVREPVAVAVVVDACVALGLVEPGLGAQVLADQIRTDASGRSIAELVTVSHASVAPRP